MKYHVRRKDREITDTKKLQETLNEARYVTLALCMENKPYLVSLSHCYDIDANSLYFHCAKQGKKIDYMKNNPKVWGQALIDQGYVDGKCNHLYTTVMFSGTVELVEDLDEKRRIFNLMFVNQERVKNQGETDPHLIRIGKDSELLDVAVGKILLNEISGKFSS